MDEQVKNGMMYLVVMYTFATNHFNPLVIAESEEKAQKYIDEQMNGKVYNGTGVHQIIHINLYN